MKKMLFSVFLTAACSIALKAQQQFTATSVSLQSAALLTKTFKVYNLFSVDVGAINAFVKAKQPGPIRFDLSLPGFAELPFDLAPRDILSADYKLVTGEADGSRKIYPKPACMTYTGSLRNMPGSRTYMTVTPRMIYGMVSTGYKTYFIEPLRYFDKNAGDNIFVIYETKDVQPRPELTCAVTEREQYGGEAGKTNFTAGIGTCKLTELAIASDFQMRQRYGNASETQNHNIAVANSMVNIYSDELFGSNYLEFKIKGQYVPNSVATDPFGGDLTTDAPTLLGEFQTWGQAGNFGGVYDVAVVWTARDIAASGSNGVIGLAYVGTTCNSFRYQILEDYIGASGPALGSLESHETGHNFNASHDASGSAFIMAPSTSTPPATTFSPASISSITNYMNTISCLSSCTAQLPAAEFNSSDASICTGSSVTITDASTGDITARTFSFPGGSPATSTSATQAVSYATSGVKTISLSVTNATGTSSISKDIFVSGAVTSANCRTTFAGNAETPVILGLLAGNLSYVAPNFSLSGFYKDNTCSDNTTLLPNTTYTATANVGINQNPFNISSKIEVYIDYNNNGVFSDPGEFLNASGCVQGLYNFTFTTPASPAFNQFLRLRLITLGCTQAATNGCSLPANAQTIDFGIAFNSLAVVPVNVVRFEGRRSNAKNILSWQTATEINSDHFVLERSVTGSDFTSVAFVNAAGSSSTLRSYSFTDPVNIKGVIRYFYRLKAVDFDGQFQYSNIVQLNVLNDNSLIVYPNPVKKGAVLQIEAQQQKTTTIAVFNTEGQLIYTRNVSSVSGNMTIAVPAIWSSGLYLLRINDGEKISTQSFRVTD